MTKRENERLNLREVTQAFIKEHNIKSILDIQNALKKLFRTIIWD